jgi:hypothetical protein
MKLLVEISVGELIDKITILELKLDNIGDGAKRLNVAREYDLLTEALRRHVEVDETLADLRGRLRSVNAELWRIEDEIRAREREGCFDARFVELARSVYLTNDRRAELKRQINVLTLSELIEEKSYAAY